MIRKNYLILLVSVCLWQVGKAQFVYRSGVYRTQEEWMKNTPAPLTNFTIVKRPAPVLKRDGGNDFKVTPASAEYSKHSAKRNLWAISRNDSLFVNGWKLHLGNWYIHALTQGRYICLRASLPASTRLQSELTHEGLYYPAGGFVFMGGRNYADARFFYVYDVESDQLEILTPARVHVILDDYPDIEAAFLKEENKTIPVMIQYIAALNAFTTAAAK